MTPEERKMLSDLADRIAQTPAPPRDPEAEEFIRTRIGKRPDALYLMTQTVLVQNLAIQQAQRQIQELQSRAAQPATSGSYGGGSFLGQSGSPSGSSFSQSSPQGGYSAPPSQYAQAPGGGAPSFLRGAAQTAAGVAAGALAFEGIRSLFSHPGYGMGAVDPGYLGGGGGAPGGETIVNNYYDNPGGGDVGRDDLNLGDNRDNFAGSDAADDGGQYSGDTLTDDGGYDTSDDTGFDDNFS